MKNLNLKDAIYSAAMAGDFEKIKAIKTAQQDIEAAKALELKGQAKLERLLGISTPAAVAIESVREDSSDSVQPFRAEKVEIVSEAKTPLNGEDFIRPVDANGYDGSDPRGPWYIDPQGYITVRDYFVMRFGFYSKHTHTSTFRDYYKKPGMPLTRAEKKQYVVCFKIRNCSLAWLTKHKYTDILNCYRLANYTPLRRVEKNRPGHARKKLRPHMVPVRLIQQGRVNSFILNYLLPQNTVRNTYTYIYRTCPHALVSEAPLLLWDLSKINIKQLNYYIFSKTACSLAYWYEKAGFNLKEILKNAKERHDNV